MMLYLTGAGASLTKNPSNPQTDANKSLGGYISSTPVPNSALNSLFDLISSYTLEKKRKETIAIGLINKFDYIVNDVEIKIVTDDRHEAIFKVAAVKVADDFSFEHIANRYQEPLLADFYDASFYRTAVEITINNPGIIGEEIMLYPFNVLINIEEEGIEGNWNSFYKAFYNDENYSIKRVKENVFRIEARNENVIELPLDCSYISSDIFSASFNGKFENKIDNSVLIKETLQPNEAVGIWIQRQIESNKITTDEELINRYTQKYVIDDFEEVELIISYNLVEPEA